MDEPSFFGAGNDSGADSGLLSDRPKEFPSVFGLARGAGGNGDNLINLMGFGQTPELRKHLKRRVHGLRGQSPPVQPSSPQTDHFLLTVDDLKGLVGPNLDHDHVDGVGADVDGCNPHLAVLYYRIWPFSL